VESDGEMVSDFSDEVEGVGNLGKRRRRPKYDIDNNDKSEIIEWDNIAAWLKLSPD